MSHNRALGILDVINDTYTMHVSTPSKLAKIANCNVKNSAIHCKKEIATESFILLVTKQMPKVRL